MNCKTLIIDVDGVLVSHVTYDEKGERFKTFHSVDNRIIRDLIKDGWRVVLMTASHWKGIFHFAERVGCEAYITNDKLACAINLGISKYFAIADDVPDFHLLENAVQGWVTVHSPLWGDFHSTFPGLANQGSGILYEWMHAFAALDLRRDAV